MKGYYDLTWKKHANAKKEYVEKNFEFNQIESKMGIKIPEDFKAFKYRNYNGEYPDEDNYNLFDSNGEIAIELYGSIKSYLDSKDILETLEISRDDIGEIYYWHLPIIEMGASKVIFDYTHCKENPPVVWVDEEIGPYEDSLCYRPWKRYIAPTFKYFIEMIGDRNKPVGDWVDQDLMADGTRAGDE